MEHESEGSLALLTHRGEVSRTLHPPKETARSPLPAGLVPTWKPALNPGESRHRYNQEGNLEEEVGCLSPPRVSLCVCLLVLAALSSPSQSWGLQGKDHSLPSGVA